eukprot:13317750-Ditylum_brightwellii.AAC.1
MEFGWDSKGKWKMLGSTADMYINTSQGRKRINRLPSSMANRILGVWLAPDGNNKKQVEVLKEIPRGWADRIRMGHIKKDDAWYYYQSTVMKSSEYSLLATTLTQEECRSIENLTLTVALESAGLPSKFPRKVMCRPSQ